MASIQRSIREKFRHASDTAGINLSVKKKTALYSLQYKAVFFFTDKLIPAV
jgi:hypothetical protein